MEPTNSLAAFAKKAKVTTQAKHVPELSDDDLDTMVRAASLPNLADLFKQGKKAGVLSEEPAYK